MNAESADHSATSSGVVISVGQCGYDNSQIRDLVRAVDPGLILKVADDLAETVDILRADHASVRLVLVNRILDADGTSGVSLIRSLKTIEGTAAALPVMLVSDIESAQAGAMAEGAVPGFGKSSIRSSAARDRLRSALNSAG